MSGLSRRESLCIQRCNQLPFKVAVNTRRAACIEGCDSFKVENTVTSFMCVRKCNARKTSQRKIAECIARCPENTAAVEKTEEEIQNSLKGGGSKADASIDDDVHPSLPMLNVSNAFVGAEEIVDHPSLPMLELERNVTDS